jgi:hypothetical protein
MAAPRKVFRIEQSGTARSERPASEADESRDSPMLRELGALRAMLAPPPAAPHVNGTLARQDELQRLASELRLLLAAIRGGGTRTCDERRAIGTDGPHCRGA